MARPTKNISFTNQSTSVMLKEYKNYLKPCGASMTIKERTFAETEFSFIHQLLYSPFLGPGFVFSSVIFFTQTVELLWRVITSSQGRCLHTRQHKQNKRVRRYPCLEWDPNPRSQRSSERRQFILQTARPLWSARQVFTVLKTDKI
jgi:hypothetical protein